MLQVLIGMVLGGAIVFVYYQFIKSKVAPVIAADVAKVEADISKPSDSSIVP